ncbi:hypothetical protein G9A89_016101 [Geosiphon pyriformis]|nr:hypothetical protein G9A89_016101 [Geosiphon pyriformis]
MVVSTFCLLRAHSEVSVGDISRFLISIDPNKFEFSERPSCVLLQITNKAAFYYRAALASGPYVISASCVDTFHTNLKIPLLNPSIKGGEKWEVELPLSSTQKGEWTIDIFSEMALALGSMVKYEVMLSIPEITSMIENEGIPNEDDTIVTFSPAITIRLLKTRDIFALPNPNSFSNSKEVIKHLVILTHGIAGTALDKLYLKEALEQRYMENNPNHIVVVFTPDINHANTLDGIENCGKRIAEKVLEYVGWPLDMITDGDKAEKKTGDNDQFLNYNPIFTQISLIGHSLGGLINTCVAGYLYLLTNGVIFKQIEPINFIAMATPWLGTTELPWYLSTPLRVGLGGQTGKDLLLAPGTCLQEESNHITKAKEIPDPLLLEIAQVESPFHRALFQFIHRTLYANIANDVLVPFQTSSMYFVDYDSGCLCQPDSPSLLSFLKHVRNTVYPPLPSSHHFLEPNSVASPVVHDKVYKPEDIPPSKSTSISIEEQIARLWHQDMTWRKILVNLNGEAHFHIVVRRKFLNVEGWQVIEHLLKEHTF